MSHITKIQTKIQDLGYLKKALNVLGMDYSEAKEGETLTLPGFTKTEIISGCLAEIKTGCSYGIGIRQTATGYELAADWWAIETFTGQKQTDILNRITRQYAYETVIDKIRDMGYAIVKEEEDARENVRLTLRRWGD
jgi:hypothetical protein